MRLVLALLIAVSILAYSIRDDAQYDEQLNYSMLRVLISAQAVANANTNARERKVLIFLRRLALAIRR